MYASISKAVTAAARSGHADGNSPSRQSRAREDRTRENRDLENRDRENRAEQSRTQEGWKPAEPTAALRRATDESSSIGDLAREFGVTLRTLRFYEARGLLAPRRDGPRRVYGADERARLTQILTGRRLGFTLAEIKDLIERPDAAELPLTREQCLAQINLLEQQKRGIEIAIAELRAIYTSFYRRRLENDGGGPGSPH